MLRAVEEASLETYNRILAIRALMQRTVEQVRTDLPKIYSKELVDVLFAQPYCRISLLEKAGIARRQTASKYLQELARIGTVRRVDRGNESYYVNDAFLEILTGE